MRFSTIFTVLATGAMAFAAAIPKTDEKNPIQNGSMENGPVQNGSVDSEQGPVPEIQNAFDVLSEAADTIIPKFDSCMDDSCSDDVVDELVTAIEACTSTLGGLSSGGSTSPALATLVAGVVTKINTGLDSHKTKCGTNCPDLTDAYAKIDSPLSLCLQKVFGLVTGLLPLVTAPLQTVADTLQGLGLNSVVKAAGLA